MSGNENIVLNASELIAQSQSMKTLKEEYDTMFNQVVSILNEMNEGWSENLSNNFSGKITTAQKGFAKIIEMLDCGETVAKEAATSFEDVNAVMARQISGAFSSLFENVDFSSISQFIGTNISLDAIKDAWENMGGWDAYKESLSYITDGKFYQGLAELEGQIFGTSYLSEADSILDLGKNFIDGKILNAENVEALKNLVNLDSLGELVGLDSTHLGIIFDGAKKIFGDGENIETLQDYVIDYAYSMEDMQAAFNEGNILEAGIGTVLYSLENSTRVIADVVTDNVSGAVNTILDITGLDESVPWSDIKDTVENAVGVDFDIVIPAITDGFSQGYSDIIDASVEGWGHIEDGLQYLGEQVVSGVSDVFSDAGSAIADWFGF